jgi:hypothetical protein
VVHIRDTRGAPASLGGEGRKTKVWVGWRRSAPAGGRCQRGQEVEKVRARQPRPRGVEQLQVNGHGAVRQDGGVDRSGARRAVVLVLQVGQGEDRHQGGHVGAGPHSRHGAVHGGCLRVGDTLAVLGVTPAARGVLVQDGGVVRLARTRTTATGAHTGVQTLAQLRGGSRHCAGQRHIPQRLHGHTPATSPPGAATHGAPPPPLHTGA